MDYPPRAVRAFQWLWALGNLALAAFALLVAHHAFELITGYSALGHAAVFAGLAPYGHIDEMSGRGMRYLPRLIVSGSFGLIWLAGTALLFAKIARGPRSRSLQSVLKGAPPVLFLLPQRSGSLEVYGRPQARLWSITPLAVLRAIGRERQSLLHVWLSQAVRALGPAVATLEERALTDLGGADAIAADGDRKQALTELLPKAKAVLVAAEDAPALTAELKLAKTALAPERLYVVPDAMRDSARSWALVTKAFADAAIVMPPTSPGPGSLIGFDATWKAVVLTTAAARPQAIASTLARHLGDPALRSQEEFKARTRFAARFGS